MKKSLDKTTLSQAGTKRVYLDEEAERILNQFSTKLSIHRSNIVAGLLRALNGSPPKRGEEEIQKQLKRVFGREQFLSFLKGVHAALPPAATPVVPKTANGEGAGREYQPDMWTIPKIDVLVLAYFTPTEENFGVMLSRILTEKLECKASCAVVACADTSSIPKGQREELLKLGIAFIALGDLRGFFDDAMKRSSAKKKPSTVSKK